MAVFVQSKGEVAGGFEGDVNRLAWSVPEVLGTTENAPKPVTTATPAKPTLANAGGLISETVTLYDYMSQVREYAKDNLQRFSVRPSLASSFERLISS